MRKEGGPAEEVEAAVGNCAEKEAGAKEPPQARASGQRGRTEQLSQFGDAKQDW